MRIIRRLGSALCATALRIICLPIAAVLYVAATFSEEASSALVALIVSLEFAKNPEEIEDEINESE